MAPKRLNTKWFEQLRSGDTRPLQDLLQLYGEQCVQQLLRVGVKNRDDAKDFFLDALLTLRERIMDERLLTCDHPDGYLYRTARNLFLKSRKSSLRKLDKQDDVLRYFYEYQAEFDLLIKKEEQLKNVEATRKKMDGILRAFNKLSVNCQGILKMFYIENKRMADIAEQMNLKNAQTAKATKSRCMRKWQEFLISEK